MSAASYKLINEESVSATTATPSVSIGTRRLEAGREYIYAYNAGGEARQGAVALLTGTSGLSFVTTAATGADVGLTMVGVVQNATAAAGSYAWVATRGIVDVYIGSAAVVLGDALLAGATVRVATYTSSLTQLVAQGIIGRSLSSGTTLAYASVYLR